MTWVNIGRVTEDIGQFKRDMLNEYPRCQVRFWTGEDFVQCHNKSTDLHHCLISKNEKFKDWINAMPWNYQPSCDVCNRYSRAADRVENREFWFNHQRNVFGLDRIRDDMDSAPNKMKIPKHSDWKEVWGWLKEME